MGRVEQVDSLKGVGMGIGRCFWRRIYESGDVVELWECRPSIGLTGGMSNIGLKVLETWSRVLSYCRIKPCN